MIIHGDNIKVLQDYANNYFDSIVTDSPYGLSFMNRHWDYDVPTTEFWKECLRVLKPGGHLLSFFGTRTYHRGVVRIEDAGFEIRDMISYIYGSGFPKSLSIPLQYEQELCYKKEINKVSKWYYKDTHEEIRRQPPFRSELANQWNGWGSALKPACEPIVVVRKPIEGTIAENVLKYGTGGINIDGGRIGINDLQSKNNWKPKGYELKNSVYEYGSKTIKTEMPQGRFPANIIFDEPAAAMLDEMSGEVAGGTNASQAMSIMGNKTKGRIQIKRTCDSGGASRFFYVAKASKGERNKGLNGFEEKPRLADSLSAGIERKNGKRDEASKTKALFSNHHPTVKPVKLMRYLVRLVTPPNGICLDPFAGSGTTGIACKLEGFNFIGIEREEEYCKIAEARINAWEIEKPDFEQLELINP